MRSTVFQNNLSTISSYTQEIFSGIRVVKAYSKEKEQEKKDKEEKKDEKKEDKEKKEKEKKEKEEKEKKDKENKEKEKPEEQKNKISKEDAQRLLDALQNDEKNLQDKMKKIKAKGAKVEIEKDW